MAHEKVVKDAPRVRYKLVHRGRYTGYQSVYASSLHKILQSADYINRCLSDLEVLYIVGSQSKI